MGGRTEGVGGQERGGERGRERGRERGEGRGEGGLSREKE